VKVWGKTTLDSAGFELESLKTHIRSSLIQTLPYNLFSRIACHRTPASVSCTVAVSQVSDLFVLLLAVERTMHTAGWIHFCSCSRDFKFHIWRVGL